MLFSHTVVIGFILGQAIAYPGNAGVNSKSGKKTNTLDPKATAKLTNVGPVPTPTRATNIAPNQTPNRSSAVVSIHSTMRSSAGISKGHSIRASSAPGGPATGKISSSSVNHFGNPNPPPSLSPSATPQPNDVMAGLSEIFTNMYNIQARVALSMTSGIFIPQGACPTGKPASSKVARAAIATTQKISSKASIAGPATGTNRPAGSVTVSPKPSPTAKGGNGPTGTPESIFTYKNENEAMKGIASIQVDVLSSFSKVFSPISDAKMTMPPAPTMSGRSAVDVMSED